MFKHKSKGIIVRLFVFLTSGTYLKKLKQKVNGIVNAIVIWVNEHFFEKASKYN
jgi:hypothetical protein